MTRTPCLIPADRIHQQTEALAKNITDRACKQKIIMVPIHEGAEMFGAGLLWECLRRHTKIVSFPVAASSYEGTKSTGKVAVEISDELHEELTNVMMWSAHKVLIIDDIYETGLTIESVAMRLINVYGIPPSSIEVVTLLHKIPKVYLRWGFHQSEPREIKIISGDVEIVLLHHVGFNVDDTIFVVGYGMDYNGQFRSLPYVGEYVP